MWNAIKLRLGFELVSPCPYIKWTINHYTTGISISISLSLSLYIYIYIYIYIYSRVNATGSPSYYVIIHHMKNMIDLLIIIIIDFMKGSSGKLILKNIDTLTCAAREKNRFSRETLLRLDFLRNQNQKILIVH